MCISVWGAWQTKKKDRDQVCFAKIGKDNRFGYRERFSDWASVCMSKYVAHSWPAVPLVLEGRDALLLVCDVCFPEWNTDPYACLIGPLTYAHTHARTHTDCMLTSLPTTFHPTDNSLADVRAMRSICLQPPVFLFFLSLTLYLCSSV